MSQVVIYGAGSFAKQMHFYFTHDSPHSVAAFSVDSAYVTQVHLCGLPVVPFEQVVEQCSPDRFAMFVAVGYKRMRDRLRLYAKAKALGYNLVNYISTRASYFHDLEVGDNNVVLANAHFEPFSRIGNNNAFMVDTLVSHDVNIGDGNFFSAKCLIASRCTVEDGCFMGNGTVLIDGLHISRETQIVAGSTVFQNTREFRKYMGSPAREIGSHEEHGIVIERE